MLNNDFQVGAFLDGTGLIPSIMQGLFFFLPELRNTLRHGFPQKELLQDMAFRCTQVLFRIKGPTGVCRDNHNLKGHSSTKFVGQVSDVNGSKGWISRKNRPVRNSQAGRIQRDNGLDLWSWQNTGSFGNFWDPMLPFNCHEVNAADPLHFLEFLDLLDRESDPFFRHFSLSRIA